MPAKSFGYQLEKFGVARRMLMAPHRNGEAQALAHAFHECDLGLHHFDLQQVDDDARRSIETLRRVMDTTGIVDPDGVGTFKLRAEQLTDEERSEFSDVVDELASYFEREFWSPE